MFASRTISVIVFVLVASLPCLAQSGSRGASSGSLQPSFQSSSPALSLPTDSFATPQTISDGGILSQPSTGSDISASTNQTPDAGSGANSRIPDASLVDPIFQINDHGSQIVIDHSPWDCFLSKYRVIDCECIARIKYGQVSCADRLLLCNYLRQLQSTDTRTLNRDEQLAFWFNLYNARVVALVLDHYPLRSIRRIKQNLTDFVGPFDDAGAVTVLGRPLSLNDIESGIIRPIWRDPRIHYALNCASYGCPDLAATAWTADDLDARLDTAAYNFINSDRAVKKGLFGLRVSKIYKWYKADFGDDDQSIICHLMRYANCRTREKLNKKQKISSYAYKWSLNDAKSSCR